MAALELPGYDVEAPLDTSGDLWRARPAEGGRAVLLRVVRLGPDPAARDAVRRSMARCGGLRSPSLLSLHTVVTTVEGLVLVYDFPAGGTLAGLLAARGRLEAGEVVTLGTALADALAAVHAAGLVHGRLDADCVHLGLDGTPVLADVALPAAALSASVDGFAAGGVGRGGPGADADVRALAALCLRALGPAVSSENRGPRSGLSRTLAAVAGSAAPDLAPLAAALRRAAPAVPIRLTGASDRGAATAPPQPDERVSGPDAGQPASPGREWVPSRSGSRLARWRPGPGHSGSRSRWRAAAEVTAGVARRGRAATAGASDRLRMARAGIRDRPRTAGPGAGSPGERSPRGAGRSRWRIAAVLVAAFAVLAGAAAVGVLWARFAAGPTPVALPPGIQPSPGASAAARGVDAAATPAFGARASPRAAQPPSAPSARPAEQPGAPRHGTARAGAPPPAAATLGRGPRSPSWVAVLTELDQRRAAAFAAADVSAVTAADAPGSPALASDQAAIRDLVRRDVRARGLRWDIVDVTVESAGPPGVTLRVVDRMSAYALVDPSGAVVAARPERGERVWRVTLLPGPDRGPEDWRLAEVMPV